MGDSSIQKQKRAITSPIQENIGVARHVSAATDIRVSGPEEIIRAPVRAAIEKYTRWAGATPGHAPPAQWFAWIKRVHDLAKVNGRCDLKDDELPTAKCPHAGARRVQRESDRWGQATPWPGRNGGCEVGLRAAVACCEPPPCSKQTLDRVCRQWSVGGMLIGHVRAYDDLFEKRNTKTTLEGMMPQAELMAKQGEVRKDIEKKTRSEPSLAREEILVAIGKDCRMGYLRPMSRRGRASPDCMPARK